MKKTERDGITVLGAKEHNLKNVSVFIPRNEITVISGLSGSGKSSLAFDVIYSEGQRRYLDSLSSYARQYLMDISKPNVDMIKGLSPSIAIDQKTTSNNPRSTVGTITEVYDYMRLLFARVGTSYCPEHNLALEGQSLEQIKQDIFNKGNKTKFLITSPVIQGEKGEFKKEIESFIKKGFSQIKIDNKWYDIANTPKLNKNKKHSIELLIDRLVVDVKYSDRIFQALSLAIELSDGYVMVEELNGKTKLYSSKHSCPVCGLAMPELEPNVFSFNSPKGACPSCDGLGVMTEYEEDGDDLFVEDVVCSTCLGMRLKPEVLSVKVGDYNIYELSSQSLLQLAETLKTIRLDSRKTQIAEKIIKSMSERVNYLNKVGTGYLSLNRSVNSLSGGEVQRVRLAKQVGSHLIGVLYVLDEPSIGLHPRDHYRLLEVIKEIKDRGNTILMVEHDEETLLSADHLIDMGPGAGIHGGEIIAEGSIEEIKKNKKSLTGQYLSLNKTIPTPKKRREGHGKSIELFSANENNLKNINFKLPLGTFCGVTGVSGSGKSTLVVDTLYKIVHKHFYNVETYPGSYKKIKGLEEIDKVIEVNQKPIGRTPRSIPATYVGLFNHIRNLYAHLPESKLRGYTPKHFSFNVKGGRCEDCEGNGLKKIEMHFLANAYVNCDSCLGKRYNHSILNIKFKEKSIADVLSLSIEEACDFFSAQPLLYQKLRVLKDVGLGYISLGQSSTSLSGGEAQRIKLAKELSKKSTGRTLFILDEPTTGLHYADIEKLLNVLHHIVDEGNTVLVIEHNIDFIKNFDYLYDLGPEGGADGGEIIDQGTPEQIANNCKGATGEWLKKALKM